MTEVLTPIEEETRIVVTGSGGLAPVSWEAIKDGQDGITSIKETVAANYRGFGDIGVKVAAGVKEDLEADPLVIEHRKSIKFMHRSALLGWLAIHRALDQANVDRDQIDPYRIGYYVGSTFSGTDHLRQVRFNRIYPTDAFKTLIARVATAPAMEEGLHGRGGLIGAECASSALAIDIAAGDLLPYWFGGSLMPARADMMIAAGADAPISPDNIRSFSGSLPGAVDLRSDPKQVSRPFDSDAQGLVMGEAGWAVVLETWQKAKARGVKPEDVVAELVGFSSFTDAQTRTLAGHEGAVRAMTEVMEMAKIALGDTVYINAHATSTPEGDMIEVAAILDAIDRKGLRASDFYVTSTKGATGHTMGAAGALEAHLSMMAIREDVVPPALKLTDPKPGTGELKLSPLKATKGVPIDVAISNSLGFGGAVTSLAFKKFAA